MLTTSQIKALTILQHTSYENDMGLRDFAEALWPGNSMHVSVKNTGNGATSGKAAWLAAGSYLAKLESKGWIRKNRESSVRVYLSSKGKELLQDYQATLLNLGEKQVSSPTKPVSPPLRLKALTLSDNSPKNPTPWLSLVEYLFKTIETRTRLTHYRGDLLLCGAADSRTANKGLAVCVVTILDCQPMQVSHQERAFIEVAPGRYAWITGNLRWLSRKFPVKGGQGFFYVDVPDDVQLIEPDPEAIAQYPAYLEPFVSQLEKRPSLVGS